MTLIITLLIILSIALGIAAALLLTKCSNLKTEIAITRERLDNARNEIRQIQDSRTETEEKFKLLASDVLNRQSLLISRQNREQLNELLAPLSDNLARFQKSVSDCYNTEARERFSLDARIKELIETNRTIGREARQLAAALKGNNRTQGDWGEMVLSSILEKSGLRKGEDFYVQECVKDGAGRLLRPDVIIRYPDSRSVVIDSKVSMTAFLEYSNSDSPENRDSWGLKHVASVKAHVTELAAKNYQDCLGSGAVDFVLMFIPSEAAYMAAMNLDAALWERAYDRRVLIVSPTLLVSALKMISQMWIQDRRTKNAIEIAEAAGRMYDKFVGFLDDMKKVRNAIEAASGACDSAYNKLSEGSGNLLSRATKLREMGAKATKSINISKNGGTE